MKTDDLIGAIAEDGAASARADVDARDWSRSRLGGLLAAVLFAQTLGMRPDIGNALQTWRFASKVLIALACFARGAVGRRRSCAPGRRAAARRFSCWPSPSLLLALAMGWSSRHPGRHLVLRVPSAATPGFAWHRSLVLSIAPLAALLVALRAGAPRSPAMAGAAAGLLAGGLAAMLYAIHCPDDSPLFVALWYVPAVALVALAGAAVGSRVLRW